MARIRRGFTMIELMVVIAVLAILAGLLIPAIQSVRESSRRSKCMNNLRQFMSAMHHYHSMAGSFPIMNGTGYENLPVSKATETRWGVFGAHAYLLPYLDQGPLYASCNFVWGAWAGHGEESYTNQTVWNTKLDIFLCPTDRLAGQDNLNSYCGSYGNGTDPWAGSTNGIFANSEVYGVRDITDGTAFTIAVTESLVGDYGDLKAKHRSVIAGVYGRQTDRLKFPDARTKLDTVMEAADFCSRKLSLDGPGPNPNRGFRWAAGSPGLTMINIIIPPNSSRYTFGACRWDGFYHNGTDFGHLFVPTSNHPGGINVAFTDSSVRFIRDQIGQSTWMSLGSRNGGETITQDAY